MVDDTPPGFGCRSMCGIGTPSTSSKRQLEDRSWLQKRVFEPFPPTPNTQKARDQYMITHVDGLQTGQEIVPYEDNVDDYATAVTGALGTTTVTFGMRGICGCTWLAVISQKRVYLGKIFTTVSASVPSAPLTLPGTFQDTTGKAYPLGNRKEQPTDCNSRPR